MSDDGSFELDFTEGTDDPSSSSYELSDTGTSERSNQSRNSNTSHHSDNSSTKAASPKNSDKFEDNFEDNSEKEVDQNNKKSQNGNAKISDDSKSESEKEEGEEKNTADAHESDGEAKNKENEDDNTFFTSNKKYRASSASSSSLAQTHEEDQKIKEPPEKSEATKKSCQKVIKNDQKDIEKVDEDIEKVEDDEIERMRKLKERAIAGLPLNFATEEDYSKLVSELAEERKKSIATKDFIEGDKINKAMIHISVCRENQQKRDLQKQEQKKYENLRNEFDRELKKFDEETKNILYENQQRSAAQLNRLQQHQNKEIEDHYALWSSESKVRQYNHASHQLMVHRRQLQLLLDQCRFTEASKVQQAVNRLEKQEQITAHKIMQKDYDSSLKKLNERHINELQFMQQKNEIKHAQLKMQRENERLTFMNKLKKIESLKDQVSDIEKVWNLAQNQRIHDIAKRSRENSMNQQNLTNQTDKLDQSRSIESVLKKQKEQPLTARQERTSTVIKLPPLNMKKPAHLRHIVSTSQK
ncbi:hypothetical protein TRFO_22507 [Tritrichomonas foetus]|uniref:Uncharacterized protein n=1 Tax=Tritrichomonas foetus TaxID=1144522 RepID=A0A1J4KGB7_9EUKA|nr:hypothetical protein TRFO_22507 [Tritrichomonas foetus]|eukprot:OHT08844.1 hypothetical protein TRFO_22507 [Tritrichomonas foetus]